MKVTVIPIVIDQQRLGKKTEGTGYQRENWGYPDHGIVKIILNTEKSPGNLGRLVVIQTPVKNS